MKRTFPWHIAIFLAPAFIIYAVFSAYPLIDTLRLSLFSTNDAGVVSWGGLANYKGLLTDPNWSEGFWNAMRNNLKFFLVHMCIQNPLALLLAALMSTKGVKFAKVYQTAIFLPTLLSVVIIGFIWKLILSPLWHVPDVILGWVHLQDYVAPWLGQEETALYTISLMSVWQFVGIPMMLIYAALIAIPDEIIEAAYVEGASAWRIFWTIRIPLILPTLGLTTILTFVGNFNAFDLIYSVKGALAGPNFSTDILGTYFYRAFFGFQSQIGSPTMGSAVATIMFLVILLGVALYFYFIQRKLQRFSF